MRHEPAGVVILWPEQYARSNIIAGIRSPIAIPIEPIITIPYTRNPWLTTTVGSPSGSRAASLAALYACGITKNTPTDINKTTVKYFKFIVCK